MSTRTTGVDRASGRISVLSDLRLALVPWAVARVAVAVGYLLARWWYPHSARGLRPVQLSQGLLAWDAGFYRAIAERGYDLTDGSLRFFPLAALAARALGEPLGSRYGLALVIISNACALGFLVVLARLTRYEVGDERVVRVAVWLGAVAPPAVALVLGYAESMLLLLSVAMFWALRHDRFGWAAAAGFAAGLCRPLGILLAAPALIELARVWRVAPQVERARAVIAVVAPVGGVVTFALWVGWRHGDAMLPFRLQTDPTLRGGFRDPVSTLLDAIGGGLGGSRPSAAVHVIAVAVSIGLVVVVARRLPLSYAAFAGLTLLVAVSAENLDSLERYALGAFPLLIAAGLVLRGPLVSRIVVAGATLGLVGTSMGVFLGRWVP